MNPSSLRLAAGAAFAAFFFTAPAFADGPAPAGIWVDAQPWTCVNEIGSFARHIELACDALGSPCQVAASVKQASFRATLTCEDPNAWTLDLQKIDGADVLKLTLEGDREQRLRKAAVWAAHASIGEPPPKAKAAGASPPAVAAPPAAEADPEPPVAAPPEPPAPPSPPPAPSAPTPPDAFDAIGTRQHAPLGGLHLSAFGAATNAGRGALFVGGRVAAAFHLGGAFSLGPTFNYAHPVDQAGDGGLYLGGLALGVGAPFGGRWLGASLEGGAGANAATNEAGGGSVTVSAHGNPRYMMFQSFESEQTNLVGYARVALILQAPIDFAVRPTLSIAGMHVSSVGGAPAEMAMVDLGVAWPGW